MECISMKTASHSQALLSVSCSSSLCLMEDLEEDWLGEFGAVGEPPDGPDVESEEDWLGEQFRAAAQPAGDGPAVVEEERAAIVAVPAEAPAAVVAKRKSTPQERMANARAALAKKRAAKREAKAELDVATPGASSSHQPLASGLATVLCNAGSRSTLGGFLRSSCDQAAACGISKTRFRENLFARCEALMHTWQTSISSMVRHCTQPQDDERLEDIPHRPVPKLFVRQRKFDETCSVLGCWWNSGDASRADVGALLDLEVGPVKLFVLESKAAMLFHKPAATPGEASAALAVTWSCPSALQAVQFNSAACYAVAIDRAARQPYDDMVDAAFPRQVDICCHDALPANIKAERVRSLAHPQPIKLHFLCDAHKSASIATKTFDLWPELPGRVIRLALATKGTISSLRRALRQHIAEKLVILGGSASPSGAARRDSFLDLFLPPDRPKDKSRRVVLRALFNGDWRSVAVVHHQTGDIPGGDAAVLRAFQLWGVPALLPRSLKVFARNNWTGSGAALGDIGLVVSCHGLLQAAFFLAFPERPQRGIPRAAAAAAAALPPAADDDEGQPGDAAAGGDSGDENWGGVEEPAIAPDLLTASDMKKQREAQVRGTRTWLRSGTCCDDLVKSKMIQRTSEKLILSQLRVTGIEWELREQERMRTDGTRRYRPLVSFDGRAVQRFFTEHQTMTFEPGAWDNMLDMSQAASLHTFRLLTRGAAACYELLHVRHRWFPYRLFDVLRRDEAATELGAFERDCIFDDYTKNFRQYHKADLAGPLARQELQLVAQYSDTDTASTERCHSENQRRSKFRVWTKPNDVSTLSCWFVARAHNRQVYERERHRKESRRTGGTRAVSDGVVLPVRKKLKAGQGGGGGPWRAYCHKHAAGRKISGELAAELSRGYAALTPEEMAEYEAIGNIATSLHREGERSFGPRAPTRQRKERAALQVALPPDVQVRGLPCKYFCECVFWCNLSSVI